MTLEAFRASLQAPHPPVVKPVLAALWWDAKGDWTKAHETAQDVEDAEGAWVHAYLHRKEGDVGNAGYWYRQAGKPMQSGPLDDEWEQIVSALL